MSRPNLGGLIGTRQGAIVLALVAAVCATGILLFAIGRYKTTAVTQPAAPAQATVLVATKSIPKGTLGDQIAAGQLYRSTPVAATQVTPGAISDASALAGRQTTTAILAGQQLTTQDLSAQPRLVDSLAADQRAISLSISEIPGSVPELQTGDEVDIYAQFSPSHGTPYNVLLERGAPVLQAPDAPAAAVPAPAATSTASSTTKTTASTTTPAASAAGPLVLGVTTSQVARVIYAAQNGQLYIALRPAHANQTPSVVTNQGTVLAGALSDNTTGARP